MFNGLLRVIRTHHGVACHAGANVVVCFERLISHRFNRVQFAGVAPQCVVALAATRRTHGTVAGRLRSSSSWGGFRVVKKTKQKRKYAGLPVYADYLDLLRCHPVFHS